MNKTRERLGFMQGRLVNQVNGKIQAFPSENWQDEFPIAARLGLKNIEWTLDHQSLANNPLCTESGRKQIKDLSKTHGVTVASITGDCFMQAPFWKSPADERKALLEDFDLVITSAASLGVSYIVLPLVDNGRIERQEEEDCLVSECMLRLETLIASGTRIVIESDLPPAGVAQLIGRLPAQAYGVNYDIGNSASLGYNPIEEINAYGERIYHVHMKDRLLGGNTVALGQGNAQFELVFQGLAEIKYRGLIVLQTARAKDGNHAEVLSQYVDMTEHLMEKYLGT